MNLTLFFIAHHWESIVHTETIDHVHPEAYHIGLQKFGLASRLSWSDSTITENLDTYVQGVYAQRVTTPGGDPDKEFMFIEAIDCTKLKLISDLPAEIAETFKGYYCPNLTEDDSFAL